MRGQTSFISALWADESGQNLTEYGLLLVLIAIAALAAIQALGGDIVQVWDRTRNMLE